MELKANVLADLGLLRSGRELSFGRAHGSIHTGGRQAGSPTETPPKRASRLRSTALYGPLFSLTRRGQAEQGPPMDASLQRAQGG